MGNVPNTSTGLDRPTGDGNTLLVREEIELAEESVQSPVRHRETVDLDTVGNVDQLFALHKVQVCHNRIEECRTSLQHLDRLRSPFLRCFSQNRGQIPSGSTERRSSAGLLYTLSAPGFLRGRGRHGDGFGMGDGRSGHGGISLGTEMVGQFSP